MNPVTFNRTEPVITNSRTSPPVINFFRSTWESYRRLGDHIGQISFSFVGDLGDEQQAQAETIFWRARAVWTVLPASYEEEFHDLNEQARELDAEMCSNALASLRAEFFPEFSQTTPGSRFPVTG
jgi:hypothetical protein